MRPELGAEHSTEAAFARHNEMTHPRQGKVGRVATVPLSWLPAPPLAADTP